MPPRKLTDDDIRAAVREAIEAARDHVASEVEPDREIARDYYAGKTRLEAEEGRHATVATKARDAVRAVKPALMRVFLQADKPVEFIPRHPGAVQAAQQATAFASYVFQSNNGFQILSDAFDDALVEKVGIVKVYLDETPQVEVDRYTGLTEDFLPFFEGDPDLEVLERALDPDTGTLDLKVAKTIRKGRIRLKSVAPENFFVDAGATSVEDASCIGHTEVSRVGDLVAMGFDFDEVWGLSGSPADEAEQERRGGREEDPTGDPSMREVLLTEAYVRLDIDGTGIPRCHKALCAGDGYTVLTGEDGALAVEPADMNPFAAFEVDPAPHAFFGRSLVDLLIDDQDTATSLLRGLLDAMAIANNPRLGVVEGQATLEDVLNNEIGAVVRMKSPGAVFAIDTGAGVAAASLPAIQYFDAVVQAKTGVEAAGMMDADALQFATVAGANAAVAQAQAQPELIARHLAEGGMRQLFEKIAQLARQHPDPDAMIRVDGQFVAVDPRSWAAPMDAIVNVGLGTGQHESRIAALMQTLTVQQTIYQGLGPGNPLVGMTEIRATLADLLAHGGIHNADRYYRPMTRDMEDQILAQQAQGAPGQPAGMDPSAALLQGEGIKAQAKLQSDGMRYRLEAAKAQAQDDRERDKAEMDFTLGMMGLGQKADEQAMRARMDAQRALQPPAWPGG